MARNKLSESRIRTHSKPGLLGDGDGLWLRVRATGSKQWFFIWRRDGKRHEMGLGGYGQGTAPVSLALARKKAEAVREKLAMGEDPRGEKRAKITTFETVMEDVIALKAKESRNEKHRDQWAMTLREYAKPLHGLDVAEVKVDDVLEVLKPYWETVPETADRLRMRIATVFDHAKARGLRRGDNPAEWKGNLKHLLPARQKLRRGHHAALHYDAFPSTMAQLRTSAAVSARAVEFAALTAARSGEVRGATWGEIDIDGALWIVPGARMKAGKEHRVPLSDRAVELLRAMKQHSTGDLVFGGERDGRPISDTAMVKSLRRASGDESTLHGLRSAFRDWAGDKTHHERDIVESALAHSIRDKTEAAYRRLDALEKRRALMGEWATYSFSSTDDATSS